MDSLLQIHRLIVSPAISVPLSHGIHQVKAEYRPILNREYMGTLDAVAVVEQFMGLHPTMERQKQKRVQEAALQQEMRGLIIEKAFPSTPLLVSPQLREFLVPHWLASGRRIFRTHEVRQFYQV